MTLKTQLLFSILFFVTLSIASLFYISYNDLKNNIDTSMKNLYSKKIDNIIYLIDQKYKKLINTQMKNSYEKIFKKGTIQSINNIFDINNNGIYPFVIDENRAILVYKKEKDYLNLLNSKDENKWIIYKKYEPWNWIVGYIVHKDIKYKELYQFRNNFLITSLLILFAIFIIINLIVKKVLSPIDNLSKVTREIILGNLDTEIEILGAKELMYLSTNFKKMRDKIVEDIVTLKKHEKYINQLNENLQFKVEERTKELEESNEELEMMIVNLKKTQKKLIETEKLASLGSLVTNLTKEINTPVELAYTSFTNLEILSDMLEEKFKKNEVSNKDIEKYLNDSSELIRIINLNLKKTVDVVKVFKQVSIDQTKEEKRVFNVKEYIKGILLSVDSFIKHLNLKIEIECDDFLEIVSYPGFFAKIITTLVSNSSIHAFTKDDEALITFKVISDGSFLTFIYIDNGRGISASDIDKIYEPSFFTNNDKISDFNMNIIYNIVTKNLKGTIACESEINIGTKFTIEIPT